MDRQDALKLMREFLDEERIEHSLRVEALAKELAQLYGADVHSAQIAALTHDLAKNMKKEDLLSLSQINNIEIGEAAKKDPTLLHGQVSAIILSQHGVLDEDILNSMRYHTTGRASMSDLECIIYIADLLEPARDFPEVERLRGEARKNLKNATIECLKHCIKYIIDQNCALCIRSIQAYNYLLKGE